MNKYLLFTLCLLFCVASGFAQIVKQDEVFTDISEVNGEIVFLKEIESPTTHDYQKAYSIMENWAKENYGKDHFFSHIKYLPSDREIVVKSRVELLLPENSEHKNEKVVMKYSLNLFQYKNRCVMEIKDIEYMCETKKLKNSQLLLPKVIKANDFITDKVLAINDGFEELRLNTKKSTLFFFNQISTDMEELLKQR